MPRNVRNFWIELNIDGGVKQVATGPRSKDGGFSMRILQRDKGDIVTALDVWGIADSDGKITLRAATKDGAQLTISTQR